MSQNNDEENLKFLLPYFDTLHDFWKERKKKNNDEEDEDNEPIDENKLEIIHNYLVDFLYDKFKMKPKLNKSIKNINLFLTNLTNNEVTSVISNYERSLLKYYEKMIPDILYSHTSESITYGEIINAWDEWERSGKPGGSLPPLWINYINSYGISNILEISVGQDDKYTSYGIVQKEKKQNIISNFILNYMFPEFTLSSNTGYISFDAKSGVVGKTFRDIDNVYNLITPANIADSAPTSFSALQNRNDFVFPSKNGIHEFTSNIYTKDIFNIQFINNNFSNVNPYGFNLNIGPYNFPFSSSQKQGPSVNYLIDLILNPKNASPSLSTIIKLSKDDDKYIQLLQNSGLPFDIKRGGDYEQVNCAIHFKNDGNYVIMSTIDILCSLFSRLNKQNTIFHVNENLSLYRFPTKTSIDPKQQKLQKTKYDSIKTLQSIKVIKGFLNGGLYSDIENLKQHIKVFIDNGIFYDKTRKFKKDAPPNNLSNLENIMTLLVKIRMIDIYKSLVDLNISRPDITLKQIDDSIPLLEEYIQNPTEEKANLMDDINQSFSITNIYKDIQKIKSLFNLTTNQIKVLNKGENILELNHEFYKLTTFNTTIPEFIYTGECKTINFSNKLYAIVYDVLNKLDRMIYSRSARNAEKNLYNSLHLMDYFTNINLIMESFKDSQLGYDMYNALQPESNSSAAVSEWYKNLYSVLQNIYNNLIQTKGGNIVNKKYKKDKKYNRLLYKNDKMKGGIIQNYEIVQYISLSDLLRTISGKAAYFLESIAITEKNMDITQLKIILYTKYLPSLISTMNEIKFIWLNGLMSIQNNIDESYIYEPTSTEYIINSLFTLFYNYNQSINDTDFNEIFDDVNNTLYEKFINQYGIINNRNVRGANTAMNDLLGLLLIAIPNENNYGNYFKNRIIPAEIIIIIVLTLIDNTMQQDKRSKYEKYKQGLFFDLINKNKSTLPSNFFDTKDSWNSLPTYLYVYTTYAIKNIFPSRELLGLLRGGFLENKNVENKNVENKNVENKNVVNKSIKNKKIKNKTIKNRHHKKRSFTKKKHINK
jgi:hypothetical protein